MLATCQTLVSDESYRTTFPITGPGNDILWPRGPEMTFVVMWPKMTFVVTWPGNDVVTWPENDVCDHVTQNDVCGHVTQNDICDHVTRKWRFRSRDWEWRLWYYPGEEYTYEWSTVSHPVGAEGAVMADKNTASLKLTQVSYNDALCSNHYKYEPGWQWGTTI